MTAIGEGRPHFINLLLTRARDEIYFVTGSPDPNCKAACRDAGGDRRRSSNSTRASTRKYELIRRAEGKHVAALT